MHSLPGVLHVNFTVDLIINDGTENSLISPVPELLEISCQQLQMLTVAL